ncbi:hypothetical protein [Actinokineospora cianjurensis]|uniref:Uncharacterized protein n=1 Tax=Actinokineospora cianjurensis TaxID=585224 RepID=A0A421B216_9PSEU|nr:hypothetical protein [Actinokineospora cianjurensis]RLK58469.1 hypothetical protein CLV68_4575 [Actinokineospora cianjurensis]
MKNPTNLNVPRGVSGKQRQLYLSLTDAQKVIYRHHFDVIGQPAGLCYVAAIAGGSGEEVRRG